MKRLFSDIVLVIWSSFQYFCLVVWSGGGQSDVVDGDAFTTVKDSKHRLQDNGIRYVALHFSAGADIFLM